MAININRLEKDLLELAKFSDTDNGITRLSFTPTYFKGRDFVEDLMKEAGLQTRVDSVGNLIGRIEGKDSNKKVIAFGSHIDTVPNGGKYDGAIGVLGAIEIIRTLKEMDYEPIHPLEVISFINEEGSAPVNIGGVFGSQAMMGLTKINEDLEKELSKIGLSKKDINNSYREPKQFKCYLEMHIEQGKELENNRFSIGVVTGIVGTWRFMVKVQGTASHAGTTPMDQRDDALLKSLPVIQYVNQIARDINKGMVGTVGNVIVKPGASNVVPGEVVFTVEFRSINNEYLEKAIELLQKKIGSIKGALLKEISKSYPVMLSNDLQDLISKVCEESSISYTKLPSFAGHDARETAKNIQSALIFIPCRNGISHSPLEFASEIDIENGINVLLETIKKIDAK